MILPKEGRLLRIHISENDRHAGMALYEWIVQEASSRRVAGATVFRGMEGFGSHNRLHTSRVLRLASDLPIVIEIIDDREKIEAFIPVIDEVIRNGMVTVEKLEILLYKDSDKTGS